MSEQGDEGQTPGAPEPGAGSGLPPRPTVRESLRRGLFVRLPTESESGEGLPGPAEQTAETSEQTDQPAAEQYEGWRQTEDGGWEQVEQAGEETYAYQQGYEPPAPETYPGFDQNANFASVAGGEPFYSEESVAPAWTFAAGQEAVPVAEPEVAEAEPVASEEALVAETAPEYTAIPSAEEALVAEAAPEYTAIPSAEEALVAEAAPEYAAIPAAEEVPVAEAIPVEAPAVEEMPVAEEIPAAEVMPVAEAVPEEAPALDETPVAEEAPAAEPAPPPEPVPTAAASAQTIPPLPDDPIASTGLYIPADVELLEGDMPTYGEKENVAPLFEGQGLGEPIFVDFSDLALMLTGLRRLLPAGTRLTYNYDYQRAWMRTSAEVDLPAFAERVRELDSEDEDKSA